MNNIVWGWEIVLYLWLAGMAGGAYATAYLVHNLNGRRHRTLLRLATYLSIPLFAVGIFLLIIELGRPERFWHLFAAFRPSSVMWFGTYFLLIGTAVGVGLVIREALEIGGIKIPNFDLVERIVTSLGFLFALIVVSYIGVVFTQTARPFWSGTFLLPWVFIASAFATGIGVLIIAFNVIPTSEPPTVLPLLHRGLALFIGIDLGLLALEVVWHLAATPSAVAPLLAGALSPLFWVGLVVLGLAVPLALELRNLRTLDLARARGGGVLLAPALVILGGLVLRYIVVYSGQI